MRLRTLSAGYLWTRWSPVKEDELAARQRGSSPDGRRTKKRGSGQSARNQRREHSTRREFEDFSLVDPKEIPEGPDVLVDVPVVKVDTIDLEVEDLQAHVAVMAEVRDILQLNVGAEVRLGKVELEIKGVEAQALLKARLENVTAILQRVATTLDRNPELLKSVGKTAERVGGGTRQMLSETGEAVEETGEGAGGAVEGAGKGAGQAVGDLGQGAGQAVEGLGEGAGQGAKRLARG
jgi:hypothetical protein